MLEESPMTILAPCRNGGGCSVNEDELSIVVNLQLLPLTKKANYMNV